MTARVYPSQQQTNLTTIGSLLVTYSEVNQSSNVSQVQCYVNSVERKLIHNNTDNLYSTFLSNGDIVRVLITTTSDDNEISVTRRDYTTDDQGGDMGIRNTYITGVTGNSPTTLEVTFTATTISLDYNFEYLITAIVKYPPSPTPTPTVTQTPTPTITPTTVPPTASPTPTPTITPTSTPAVLNYAGGKFDYDFQNFRTYPGTGLIFKDVTNSGNNATLITGATYQGSVSPYYYNMDSTYATSLFNPGNYYGYLYGGWFKVETTGVANVFMKKGDGLELGITSGNTIYAYFENILGTNRTLTAENMEPGYWYYIMAYYDYNLTGQLYLYVNGLLVSELPLNTFQPNLAGTGTPFIIGNGSPTQSFQLGEAECYAQAFGGINNVPTIIAYNLNQKSQFYTIRPTPTPTPSITPTNTPIPLDVKFTYDAAVLSWGNIYAGIFIYSGRTYFSGGTAAVAPNASLTYSSSVPDYVTTSSSFVNTRTSLGSTVIYGTRQLQASIDGPSFCNYSRIELYKNGSLIEIQYITTNRTITNTGGITETRTFNLPTPANVNEQYEIKWYDQVADSNIPGPTSTPTPTPTNTPFLTPTNTVTPTPTPVTPTPTPSPIIPVTIQYKYFCGILGSTVKNKTITNNRMNSALSADCRVSLPNGTNNNVAYNQSGQTIGYNCSYISSGFLSATRTIYSSGGGGNVSVSHSDAFLYEDNVLIRTTNGWTGVVPSTPGRTDSVNFAGLTIIPGKTYRLEWYET
jgi:hypothetical protein